MTPYSKIAIFFTLFLFTSYSTIGQDTIAIKTFNLVELNVFNNSAKSKNSFLFQYKIGAYDWKPAGPRARNLKPVLTALPESRKYWKKFKTNIALKKVSDAAEFLGYYITAAWLVNEIDGGNGKDVHLYSGVTIFYGGMLLSNMFRKKAKKNLYKSIGSYNNRLLLN